MYNLFLGTAKYIMKQVWLEGKTALIDKRTLKKVQAWLDSITAPSGYRSAALPIALSSQLGLEASYYLILSAQEILVTNLSLAI